MAAKMLALAALFISMIFIICSCDASGDITKKGGSLTTTTSSHLDPHTNTYNRVIFTVVSLLSALGSVVIIVTYFLWRDLQTTVRRILVYISIGDFFAVYPSLVIFWTRQYKDDGIACQFQSFVTSTAIMWSFFWTSSLAVFVYIALVKKRHDISEKLMVLFHVVNWCLPTVLLGAALYKGELGSTKGKSTAGWCWIRIGEDHNIAVVWMLICGKFWEIVSYIINGALYYGITHKIKREVSERFHLLSSQAVQIAEQSRGKLVLVPVVFVVLRIWGTIRFILFAFSANPPHAFKEVMFTLQIIGDNAQGITNFVLFCVLTEKFKQQIRRLFRNFNHKWYETGRSSRTRESPNYRRTFSDTQSTCTFHS